MNTAILSTELFFAAANESGWYRISPYGDFANTAGMQRVDRESGAIMASSFTGAMARVKHWLTGGTHSLPAYLGHPDEPAFANTAGHDDTTRYAEITGIEAREDGIYAQFAWANAWADVQAKLPKLYISPRWAMIETAKGSGIFSPRKLLSVGLTPTPNIPSTSAVNADPTSDSSTMNKENLIKLLAALGQTLEATATDDQLNAAIDAAIAARAQANTEDQKKDDELEKAKTDLAAANASLTAANAATAAERRSRAAEVVTVAIANGKITAAERAAWEGKLLAASDFVSVANELAAQSTGAKTTTAVNDLAARNAAQDAGEKLNALANERAAKTGESRNAAYVAVCNTAEGKALLEKMKIQPAA